MLLAAITIGIDPTIELGPVTLAWHGITIAVGIVLGGLLAGRFARERGIDPEPLYTIGLILGIAALVGARLFFLLEEDPAGLLRPADLFANQGFTFGGGLILAAVAIATYLRVKGLTFRYLDAVAAGLPFGVAVGRIGDVINGEHYGRPTDFFLGVRNTHPDALTPRPEIAYHSGGLYEMLLAATIFAVVWPLRHRLRRPTALVWPVLALFAVGRFAVFFFRADDAIALGLSGAQWTSLALLVAAALGALWTLGRPAAARPSTQPSTGR